MNPVLHKSEIKLEALCRTCLSKEIELHSVFDVCLGTVSLDSVIATVTGIKIAAGDGLPATVCRECRDKATNAFHFKSGALAADEALRGLLGVVKSEGATHEVPLFESPPVDIKNEVCQDTFDNYITVEYDESTINGEPLSDAGAEGASEGEGEEPGEEGASTYCPVCGVSCPDAAALTRHVWRHHADIMGPKKRGRPKQLLTSSVVRELSARGYTARAARRLTCALCRAPVAPAHLARHMHDHKDVKLLSCVTCKKLFLKKKDFERHSCGDAERERRPDCPENDAGGAGAVGAGAQAGTGEGAGAGEGARRATQVSLQSLMMQNADTGGEAGAVQLCGECGAVLLSGAALARHRERDHPDRSLRCPHCHKVFLSVRGAARHRGSCARVERAHACALCSLRFAHAISLNKHTLRAHAGHPVAVRFPPAPSAAAPSAPAAPAAPTVHKCDACPRTFRRKESLLNHLKLHKPGEKCFECDVCHKKFNRRNNLRSHMRTHESRAARGGGEGEGEGKGEGGGGSKACLCLYCGRGFSNSSNLIVHMRRHTGEKPYKCDFCGKGFPRSSDLQCHRRSHTGEKPCVCGVCGKGFSRSNKLSRHMRVHTGLKPYKCTYCERAFSQSNDLTLHVRRHTGDKPYVCELCGDRFIQGTALHNHRRAHGHFPPSHAASASNVNHVNSVNINHVSSVNSVNNVNSVNPPPPRAGADVAFSVQYSMPALAN